VAWKGRWGESEDTAMFEFRLGCRFALRLSAPSRALSLSSPDFIFLCAPPAVSDLRCSFILPFAGSDLWPYRGKFSPATNSREH
jgi:hypothetical protein